MGTLLYCRKILRRGFLTTSECPLPSSKNIHYEKLTSCIVPKRTKMTSKKSPKKEKVPFDSKLFFRRIPELSFQREHSQSTPLGRFTGGRATQNVAPTTTCARFRISNFSEIPKLLTKARHLFVHPLSILNLPN